MIISDEDVQHFIRHPLEKITSHFHKNCDYENFKMESGSSNEGLDLTPISDLLLILLSSFQSYAQDCSVPSTADNNMSGRIFSIYKRMKSKAIQISYFQPLVTSILFNSADVEIWSHLTDLVDNLEPITPVQHDASSSHHPDAQHIYTTAQLKGADETMDILKDALRKELTGTVFEDVTGFYEKFFEKPLWASKCQKISESYSNRKDQESFKFPDDRTEANVWQWIKTVQTKFIEPYRDPPEEKKRKSFPLRGQKFRTTNGSQIKGGPCFRQVDFFIKSRSLRRGTPHSWRDIQVLGEITKLPTSAWMDKFLQLAVYIREVFTAQPLRKFVHGFLLLDTKLQLWISWRAVDRLSEVSLLMQARDVRGVARLIGSRDDSKISELREGLTITSEMERDVHPDDSLMTTTVEPIEAGPSIPAESNEHCTSEKRKDRTEDSIGDDGDQRSKRIRVSDVAREAQDNAAVISDQGIGNTTGSGKVAPVEIVRRSTRISSGEPVKYFVPTRKCSRSCKSESSKSGSKRRRNPDHAQDKNSAVPERDLKRLRISSTAGETVSGDVTAPISTQVGSLTSAPGDRAGDGAESTPTAVNDGDAENPGTPELSISYRDRQKTFIATEPHGRSIGEETTALDLLQGIRDAILAHQSLFKEARILHRDVSINNIILTDPAVNNGRYGLLIDLDLAISLNDVNSDRDSQIMTGTMEYIALGILEANIFETGKGYKHTYRHDLESFFYVLVSACIRFGWGDKKSGRPYILASWYTGTVKQMYDAKHGAMGSKFFQNLILNHFSARYNCVKALVTRLRAILFDRSTGVDTSTNPFADEVYDLILKAFDDEIKGIKCEY
ncbi:Bgt-50753 [Blumeria graminis f. sp. tritici]|uniref:non-specific serine/threonine protein kinase n=1 Tax=Blumeria graminis f. sp. tritici TaxID=62690 RepID=A0A9X9LB68_BLUGR|nr:Bgt-50753 [Blumeria graminis f. sp. tritici]